MKKIVTYEKMSKKEKRKIDRLRRRSWGLVKPATVTHKDEQEYDRAREKRELRRQMEE